MSRPFSSPPFPPLENPVTEVTFNQTAVLFNSHVMCVACLCLNSKLAFLLLVLLFVPIGQFPPLYLAGQIVKIQCNAEDAYSKGGNKNDDDGDDVFIQFCPSTEDRIGEVQGQGGSPCPSPPSPVLGLILPSPLKSFVFPCLDKTPTPLGDSHPGPSSRGATVTLNSESNVFADRAQLVSGRAAVGSSVVLGCLLWHLKVEDHSIPGTYQ